MKRSEEEDDKDDAHRLSRYRLAIKRRLAQKVTLYKKVHFGKKDFS